MTPLQEQILRKYAGGAEVRHISAALGCGRDEVEHVVVAVCGWNRAHARHLVGLLQQPTTAPAAPVRASKYADPPRRRHASVERPVEPAQTTQDLSDLVDATPAAAAVAEATPVAPEATQPAGERLTPAQPPRRPRAATSAPPRAPKPDRAAAAAGVDQAVTDAPSPAPVTASTPIAISVDDVRAAPLLTYPAWWCSVSTCHRRQFDPGDCPHCRRPMLPVTVEIHRRPA